MRLTRRTATVGRGGSSDLTFRFSSGFAGLFTSFILPPQPESYGMDV